MSQLRLSIAMDNYDRTRAFRHTSIHVRSDRGIDGPAELKGRRLGTPEYQLTACVWAREKIPLQLPPEIRFEEAPDDLTLSQMRARGDVDGIIGPRGPSCFERAYPHVRWLFPDPSRAAAEYFQRTRICPQRRLKVAELFRPSTLESCKI